MSAQGLSREAIEAARHRVSHPDEAVAVLSAAYPFIRRDVAREIAEWVRERSREALFSEQDEVARRLDVFATMIEREFASVREGVES